MASHTWQSRVNPGRQVVITKNNNMPVSFVIAPNLLDNFHNDLEKFVVLAFQNYTNEIFLWNFFQRYNNIPE